MRKAKPRHVRDFDYSLFVLGEVFEAVRGAVPSYSDRMDGRCVGSPWDMGILGEVIAAAGNTDYLEIGSYWGGSMIVAGMTKRVEGLGGRLISIDPYTSPPLDEMEGRAPGADDFFRNMRRYGLKFSHYMMAAEEVDRVELIEKYDIGVVYVDGDHSRDGFEHDLKFATYFLPDWIVIDNVDTKYPHIYRIMMQYLTSLPYRLVHLSGITAVLKKDI